MTYKVTNKQNNIIGENLTLGKAFDCINNWCNDNDGVYGLGNIYHEFDNQIGIDVYVKNNIIEQFHIIEE